MAQATDKQKRAIRFLLRKYNDTVKPLLDERGGVIDSLTSAQASEIISAVNEKHPKGGEQKKDEQEDDQQQEKQQDDDGQKDEQNQEEKDDEEEHRKKMRRSGFRPGSKQEMLANALRENGMDPDKTREALRDKIGVHKSLIFTQNVNQQRVPLPMGSPNDDSQQLTQHGRALKTIFAVRRALIAAGQGEGDGEKKQEQKQDFKRDGHREATEYLAWVRQLRKHCMDRAADGHPLDEIGLRPVEYGALMLREGIPLVAIKHAITMHYPPEARRVLGVRDYDVQQFRPEQRKDGMHAALPYLLAIINAGMPAALVGPKGTGKTTLAKQSSDVLALPFGMVSMTSGTSPSAFNGRPRVADDGTLALITALAAAADCAEDDKQAQEHAKRALELAEKKYREGDTVLSQFCRIYGGGGIFLFDEMDAADENLLLGVNAALANGFFANPATGEIIEQHPDFHPIAGMNTLGLGSGRDYNSRNRLDAATLDRWNAGRIQITLDPRIEESMFWSIINEKG